MKLYSTKKVAELLGYKDDSAIRHLIDRGKIKAQKLDDNEKYQWIILEDEVKRLLKSEYNQKQNDGK